MIREITMHDLHDVHDLNVIELDGTSDVDTLRITVQRILDHPDQHVLLGYEKDGKIIGYVHAQLYEMLYNPYSFFNIISMAVSSDYQGEGIGSQLLDTIEEIAKEKELDGIRINSGENRKEAHTFYQKHNYESRREQKRFIKYFD